MEEDQFSIQREGMVREQIERRGITDPHLLDVLRRVPRHLFVPPDMRDRAYTDGPLPIGENQTISQPFIVAAMTDLLALHGQENVLEVGTGSGYQAAVLGELTTSVHTIERHPLLAQRASQVLQQLSYQNISIHIGDGSLGWPSSAPYQRILVTAAAPRIPAPLVEQLDEGGILVIPVGPHGNQYMERWRKNNGEIRRERLFPVAFVPLLGSLGWQEDKWNSNF